MGGVALVRAGKGLDGLVVANDDQKVGVKILSRAIQEPLRMIVRNAGHEPSVVLNKVLEGKGSYGYNAANASYGDMLEMGILDPAKVTRLALQNAASVASLLLTSEAMVAELPKKEEPLPAGGGAPGMGGMGDF